MRPASEVQCTQTQRTTRRKPNQQRLNNSSIAPRTRPISKTLPTASSSARIWQTPWTLPALIDISNSTGEVRWLTLLSLPFAHCRQHFWQYHLTTTIIHSGVWGRSAAYRHQRLIEVITTFEPLSLLFLIFTTAAKTLARLEWFASP